jgi:cyclophilin family peptidyl-prolyl cis-trans isomerase
MRKMIIASLAIFCIGACNLFKSDNNIIHQIHKLEFTRNSIQDNWNRLRSDPAVGDHLVLFANSIGKTRQVNLLPVLEDIVKTSNNDLLTAAGIFAIGQMGTREAEQILLNLPFRNYPLELKASLLQALTHCASQKTVDFYETHFQDPEIRSAILLNAALCARKKLNTDKITLMALDSVLLQNPTKELSYYLYYTANRRHLAAINTIIAWSKDLTRTYALKKLSTLYQQNKTDLVNFFSLDTLGHMQLKYSLTECLKGNSPWQHQYYALQVIPIVADSLLLNDIQRLVKHPNPHIQLSALRALAEIDPDKNLSTLLSYFQDQASWFTKGALINILAEYYPQTAYLFIMQNLDKGDRLFKGQLLDALAKLNTPISVRTLRQFVFVDDSYLSNTAFNNLATLKQISRNDVNHLLESDDFSNVATAIDYLSGKKEKIDRDLLLRLFSKFRMPSEVEVQLSVIKAWQIHNNSNEDEWIDQLWASACHDIIRRRLLAAFPEYQPVEELKTSLGFQTAKYLEPDSIIYFEINPMIEIETEKGTIEIELHADKAPITVYSFLKLVEMNFYDGLIFHRVVPDFVIQGGDPLGNGWGGPNYFIPSEHNELPFDRGSVGIATSGFDTGSSQFFICQSEQPHLNGNYTLFGQVKAGIEIVDRIVPGDKILTVRRNN